MRDRHDRNDDLQECGKRPAAGLDPAGNERLTAVGEHDHVSRLDVRRGMLDQAEVVAGHVVEAVAEGDGGTLRAPALTYQDERSQGPRSWLMVA